MRGITITDMKNGVLAFDLIDILNIVGDKALDSLWEVSNVEAVGESADSLHYLSDANARLSGSELRKIATGVDQVIDGTFMAYLNGANTPWLLIRAVDSSAYDVESTDESILSHIRGAYTHVTELPT